MTGTINSERSLASTLPAFQFESHIVRVEFDANGEPLFHANDLCAILAYNNPHAAIVQHVDSNDLVKREVTSDSTKSRVRKVQPHNFVREPGMWALILGSRTERAKIVKRWVTSEVLPAIRKTGGYSTSTADPSAATLALRNHRWLLSIDATMHAQLSPVADNAYLITSAHISELLRMKGYIIAKPIEVLDLGSSQ